MRSRRAKIHFAKLALFVLLALQLVIGLQLRAAQAAHDTQAAALDLPAAIATSHPDCPSHAGELAAGSHTLPVSDSPVSGHHDCCHASACQCHCVNPPVSIDLPVLANIATPVAMPSLPSTQFLGLRIDEFLRPPIA